MVDPRAAGDGGFRTVSRISRKGMKIIFTLHTQQAAEPREPLQWLTSSALDDLPHCFSTRRGGVSTGCRASLSLRLPGDDPENVEENFRILGAAVGFRPEQTVFAQQMHGDVIRPVTRETCGTGLYRPGDMDCDALFTRTPGVALTVFSADCCPILLHCTASGTIAAVHAGWRGTALGIVKKTVAAMQEACGAVPAEIHAAIGPCISRCCFKTDADVPDAMRAALGAAADPAIEFYPDSGKYHVDLKALNRTWLQLAGVPDSQIDTCSLCTCCREDLFFSHRRTGDARGSLAAVIMLPEAAS